MLFDAKRAPKEVDVIDGEAESLPLSESGPGCRDDEGAVARLDRVGEREDLADEGIAELIVEMWHAGIVTTMTCQECADPDDEGSRVWIEFDDPYTLAQFVDIAAGPPDSDFESLYNRACGRWEPNDWQAFRRYRRWHYSLNVMRFDEHGEAGPVLLCTSVRFPVSDYPAVLERVQAWNKEAP